VIFILKFAMIIRMQPEAREPQKKREALLLASCAEGTTGGGLVDQVFA
jgi:hypothetical protein